MERSPVERVDHHLDCIRSARASIEFLLGIQGRFVWIRNGPRLLECQRLLPHLVQQESALTRLRSEWDALLALERQAMSFACPSELAERIAFLEEAIPLGEDIARVLALARCHPYVTAIHSDGPAISTCREMLAALNASWPACDQSMRQRASLALEKYRDVRLTVEGREHVVLREYRRLLAPLRMEVNAALSADLQAARLELAALEASHDREIRAVVAGRFASNLDGASGLLSDSAAASTQAAALVEAEAAATGTLRRLLASTEAILLKIRRTPPSLGPDDIRLTRGWASDAGATPYRLQAMESARQAELVAKKIYSELYGEAEDLAILQVRSPEDARWKVADVAAGGRWIDVKNARRSYSSPDSYSEHCVPRFKTDRQSRHVAISGFLSPAPGVQTAAREKKVVWLGETSQEILECLAASFSSESLKIDLAHGALTMLPPWIYEYPSACYRERNAAIEELNRTEDRFPITQIPVALELATLQRSLRYVRIPRVFEDRPPEYNEELRLLVDAMTGESGITRPAIFLHILSRFCASATAGVAFESGYLRDLLFPPDEWEWMTRQPRALPLAVCDPLETSASLIDLLEKVAATCASDAIRYDCFRLRGPNVLQGRRLNGESWETIYAYCGGWGRLRDQRLVRCGQNPVFLGRDHPCGSCGHLVCHRCGYCSARCQHCEERQADWLPL